MAIELTYHGHSALGLEVGGAQILIDPFFSDNPACATDPATLPADFILVSHGHSDHIGDAVSIAKRTGATVIGNYEVASWLSEKGVENVHLQHVGGGFTHSFGYLKLTPAMHGSGLPDGSCGGAPCGFLLKAEGKTLYFACDTGLFGDMALIGAEGVDFAALPIGDNFTMGPDDAFRAIAMIKPRVVVPIHYNTWETIVQDAEGWRRLVEASYDTRVFPLSPGQRMAI